MKQKTKSKKFKKNKTLRKALAFFCFFIFTFSLLSLNVTCYDLPGSGTSQTCAIGVNKAEAIAPFIWGAAAGAAYLVGDAITGDDNVFVQGFKWILYGFFLFFSWILGLAGFLFDWAVDANNIRDVIHTEAIYNAWKMVRDFLNLGFILILLYSAFCTVFQIEKYHLKKILLMLVLMALLVNFSFPISRFIVDASNVTMYFFLQSAFGEASTSFSAGITKFTGIADILVPKKDDGGFDSGISISQILMAVFFVICLMITMFVIAAILVIRIVALAVLIIFSSIGFVAAVLPDTKTFANKWWSNLFKYAFAGPILVFMLLIAYNLMAEMADKGILEKMTADAQNYGSDPSELANAAYFFIPIVLLWMGIFSTRTMSIFGANWVTSKAKGAAKIIPRVPFKGAEFVADKTGVSGGAKEGYAHFRKTGELFGKKAPLYGGSDAREAKEAKWSERFGVKGAKEQQVKTKAAQYKKDNVSETELNNRVGAGDHAAALRLAEDGNMKADTYALLQGHLKDSGPGGKDKPMKDLIDKKVSQNNTEAIVKYRIDKETAGLAGAAKTAEEDNIVDEEYGKLNIDSWKKQGKLYKTLDPTSVDVGDLAIQRIANAQFRNLKPEAQIDIAKNATGGELVRMRGANFPV